MSIRTTVTLDEDVVAKLKEESLARATPFGRLLNEAIRSGLLLMKSKPARQPYVIVPVAMGTKPGINYDNIGALIEVAEGEDWR